MYFHPAKSIDMNQQVPKKFTGLLQVHARSEEVLLIFFFELLIHINALTRMEINL